MSYFTQMVGLAVHNFISAATGIAVADRADPRPAPGAAPATIGNFWVDLTRGDALHPAADLPRGRAGPGRRRACSRTSTATSRRRRSRARRRRSPGAGRLARRAIKQLGHQRRRLLQRQLGPPVREPDAADQLHRRCSRSSLIPAGADLHLRPDGRRHAPGLGALGGDERPVPRSAWRSPLPIEQRGNPLLAALGVDQAADGAGQAGGNMEGKEVRFGIAASALWAVVTTAASCGAVNAMHDSFTPLGGLVPLLNMQLGEVIFGGVGAGPVRHADLRHPGRLHRRADGRAHARVPRQEDRGRSR